MLQLHNNMQNVQLTVNQSDFELWSKTFERCEVSEMAYTVSS